MQRFPLMIKADCWLVAINHLIFPAVIYKTTEALASFYIMPRQFKIQNIQLEWKQNQLFGLITIRNYNLTTQTLFSIALRNTARETNS